MGCLLIISWFDLINEVIFQQRKNEMLLFLMFQRVGVIEQVLSYPALSPEDVRR